MNKEIKTLEDLENYCKKNTGHGINVPPFVYIDKYFEDIEKAYENGYRAGYEEGSNYSVDEEAKEVDNVKNSYLAIKATQRQSCEDEDITKAFQLGLALGLEEKYNEINKGLEGVKKSITPQSCEDAISRQAVLDRMKECDEELSSICPKDIKDLPPVIPQPKMGRWLVKRVGDYDHAICSVCGDDSYLSPEWDALELYRYCPNCGAKMSEVENGKDND